MICSSFIRADLIASICETHPIPDCNFSAGREPIRFGQFEFCEIKPRCNRASDQCPVAATLGSLPRLSGHNRLRYVACDEIRTQPDAALAAVIGNLQGQRAAGVIMPDLDRIDAMPMRALAACQQEIDRC